MNIKWFGQSCFYLVSQEGTRLLIDPYARLLGYRMPLVEADIVAVSHNHRDHNQVKVVRGNYLLANEPVEYTRDNVMIKGIKTFHDNQNGAKRGGNIVFVFHIDGMTVCHCGDLGHRLTEEQVKEIGPVDVLMVPVGGTRTLNAVDARHVMHQLQPVITIPMHYRTRALGIPGLLLFDKVDDFLAIAEGKMTTVKTLNLSKDQLVDYAGVVTLQYK
ncbi:MAG: MBL fold metallo-hydrolase [Gorillibacterium sp.]|nr:MBL fold metallo-hydrolase [Gorillibacterium sp.]